MVTHIHRIIHTIGEKVITTNISSNTGDRIIRIYPPTDLRIVITAGYIIEPSLRIVVVTSIAEGVDVGNIRRCNIFGILAVDLYELAPSVVGVGYGEFAGGGIGEGYYITLYIVDVIIEVVAAVRHGDTVALLVVEEAQCLAVGRLGENLRAVEQVLGRICAVTLAGSDAFRIVSKGNCFILYRFCKLPALPYPTHHGK